MHFISVKLRLMILSVTNLTVKELYSCTSLSVGSDNNKNGQWFENMQWSTVAVFANAGSKAILHLVSISKTHSSLKHVHCLHNTHGQLGITLQCLIKLHVWTEAYQASATNESWLKKWNGSLALWTNKEHGGDYIIREERTHMSTLYNTHWACIKYN